MDCHIGRPFFGFAVRTGFLAKTNPENTRRVCGALSQLHSRIHEKLNPIILYPPLLCKLMKDLSFDLTRQNRYTAVLTVKGHDDGVC
jgi:hypothetical protein